MAFRSLSIAVYIIQLGLSEIIINRPSGGEGPIVISDEDLEHYYYNPDRILFVFNRSCASNINQSQNYDQIQQAIDIIKSTYSQCLNLTDNKANVTHFDTKLYSYVFFDLLCTIFSINEGQHSNLSINYNDLCIEYIIYEPLFNLTQQEQNEESTLSVQTVPVNTPQFACMRLNTAYYESYGMDMLDSEKMDYRYSYPQFTNITIANERKIDIHILDSGIQANHVEFDSWQVIHKMGDGPATFGDGPDKYGDHGTHVAGIATGKNYGAARNFTIYDYRVCEFTANGEEMPCYGSLIFEALFSVYEQIKASGKPAVINLSLGGPKATPFDDAYQHYFEEMIAVGGIPVVAAGFVFHNFIFCVYK